MTTLILAMVLGQYQLDNTYISATRPIINPVAKLAVDSTAVQPLQGGFKIVAGGGAPICTAKARFRTNNEPYTASDGTVQIHPYWEAYASVDVSDFPEGWISITAYMYYYDPVYDDIFYTDDYIQIWLY